MHSGEALTEVGATDPDIGYIPTSIPRYSNYLSIPAKSQPLKANSQHETFSTQESPFDLDHHQRGDRPRCITYATMSLQYSAVGWNKQKKRYNQILWLGIALFLAVFVGLQLAFHPNITAETLILRGTSVTAFVLLHIILIIGPLCRLNERFLPLLYNRRHMGVSMFLVAAVHGIFSIIQFHALGDTNAFVSVFTSNENYVAISDFPFQVLGFFALIIFFLMAVSSHDFWLKNLSPRFWKNMHMLVYVAYALIFMHVATGALQYETNPIYWVMLVGGFTVVAALHIASGIKENRKLRTQYALKEEGYYEVCSLNDLEENCGKSVFIDAENIAIFKYNGKVSAVNNVCKHQMGPIGEGRVIDDCITCPWHGYQYLPANGQSPPPFDEKLSTYRVKLLGNMIWVNASPLPEGTFVEPAVYGKKLAT
ncbi:MAG: Rieske 2Fe-2S domain-containing protein [Bacteroidia bacterium]